MDSSVGRGRVAVVSYTCKCGVSLNELDDEGDGRFGLEEGGPKRRKGAVERIFFWWGGANNNNL